MGDYTKIIVNCSLKKTEDLESLRREIYERLPLISSAYHCGGEILQVGNEWHHRTDITLVAQAKYGRGIQEFIEWLRPQVIDGFGEGDIFAVVASEHCEIPRFYKRDE
jgi:hypothetical protein